MKRQFFLDPIERDLIRTALGYLRSRIDDTCGTPTNVGTVTGRFTQRRIDELLARLQEPETP